MNNLFKIRASASGQIMTNPRSKTELLSETTKSYVYDWLKEQIYGYRKQLNNKYVNKGLQLEDKAIDKAIEVLNIPFAIKNEKYYEDDFFCGTPDLIVDGIVYDIKCSWDCFTFPLFDTEIPTKGYFYQLQVYMHLLGLKKAKLVYVLINTPEELTYEEKHYYSVIDEKYKIKTFEIDYDAEVIADLQQRVENIRNFITTIKY